MTTPRRPEAAFQFMAAFENVAAWDPSVVQADRVRPGDLGVGSCFRVIVSSAVRKLTLLYRITEFDPPRRLVLLAETATLRSIDEIIVEPRAGGATVTYEANLELLGPLRFFNLPFGLVFERVGNRAAAGLRRELQK